MSPGLHVNSTIFGFLLSVPEHRLRNTKEIKDGKQLKQLQILIPSDQKYKAFRYLQKDPIFEACLINSLRFSEL